MANFRNRRISGNDGERGRPRLHCPAWTSRRSRLARSAWAPRRGKQFRLHRDCLAPEPDDLGREAGVNPADLLAQPMVDPVNLLVEAVDLLVEHADVAAEGLQLRGDDVLERLLDLVVDTHGPHSTPNAMKARPWISV